MIAIVVVVVVVVMTYRRRRMVVVMVMVIIIPRMRSGLLHLNLSLPTTKGETILSLRRESLN